MSDSSNATRRFAIRQILAKLTIYVLRVNIFLWHKYFYSLLLLCFLAPGSPPAGVVLDNQNPYRISVFWNPPNIPNGVITRYIIYAGYENGSVDVFYMNGKSTAYNISNLYPFQIIGVKISAGTIIGEGPRTPHMEVQTAQTRKCYVASSHC